MKRFYYALLLILILGLNLAVASTGTAVKISSDEMLKLELLRSNPYLVSPGSTADVWIRASLVSNYASDESTVKKDLHNVKIELVGDYPFSPYSPKEGTNSFYVIQYGDRLDMKFKVRIDPGASEGENSLRFKITADELSQPLYSGPVSLNVGEIKTVLGISDVSLSSDFLEPGKNATLMLRLKNYANTIVHGLTLSFSSPSIKVLNSPSTRRLSYLEKNGEKLFSYNLMVLPSTSPGIYSIPLNISYYDAAGSLHSVNEMISLEVRALPEYLINLEDSDTFQNGYKGKVTISVSNRGLGEMKFTTLTLDDNDHYQILGKSQEYLGNLDSDDFETAEFEIYVNKRYDGKYLPLHLTLTYRDPFNELHTEHIEYIKLKLFSEDEIRKYGLKSDGMHYLTYIFYILLAVLIYFTIQEYREHDNLTKSISSAFERLLLLILRILLFWRPSNLRLMWRRIKLFFKKL